MEPTREQSTERIDGTDGMRMGAEEGQARHAQATPTIGGIGESHANQGNIHMQVLIGEGNQKQMLPVQLPPPSPASTPSEGSWKDKLPPLGKKPGKQIRIEVQKVNEGIEQQRVMAMFENDKDLIYPGFANPRGLCMLINNENFKRSPRRTGTHVDRENLRQLFEQLGYRVQVEDNLTAKQMKKEVKRFAKDEFHTSAESAIIVVLTHGEHEKLLGVDDNAISIYELLKYLSPLKAPGLNGKPKIVFIQACRGDMRDRAGTDGVHDDNKKKEKSSRTSREADFFVGYSTPPHYVSWRNEQLGSWFIQAICQIFPKFAHKHDLATLMTMVNQRVCDCFENSDEEADFRQISEFTSRLRKKFYFFPGIAIQGSSAI